MQRLALGLLVCALAAAPALACKRDGEQPTPPPIETVAAEPEPPAPPRLVVVVVVDQMRFDYYERFGSQWRHGFATLRERGRFFTQARHAHALTETAPGHATISTGTHPAQHGIVANSWFDRSSQTKVNAVDDPAAKILGNEDATGASAATLLREGVGDWLQAHDESAVVISLSIKDRAAILLGGKRPDAAIWYDDKVGGYTTSTYYAEQVPAWVEAYNQRGRAEALYGDGGWTLSLPEGEYGDSRREIDPKFVSTFSDYSLTKRFPHVIDVSGKQPRNVMRDTPFGDQMTLELALEAIEAEHMGEDAVPDLLLLSMSGGDYAGHRYGPNSIEIHDYYLRLDQGLGEFVAALDQRLGDDYVLILTSDHGVAPMPEYSDIETAGRFVAKRRVPSLLDATVKALKLGKRTRPSFDFTHGVELSFPADVDEAQQAEVRAALAGRLRDVADLADAWTRDELSGSEDRTEFAPAWRMSFHPDRSSDILLQYAPGVVAYGEGTGHGTPYDYDQHVPLIIVGRDWTGEHTAAVRTVDIAPTIATLVEVPVPEGVDGVAIVAEPQPSQ